MADQTRIATYVRPSVRRLQATPLDSPVVTDADTASFHPATRADPDAYEYKRSARRVSREHMHRRGLVFADLAALATAVVLGFYAIGHTTPALPLLVGAPVFILLAKMTGLYDRDELLLRRTTLEEVPRLISMASVGTLGFWLGESWFVRGGALEKPQVFVFWLSLVVGLPLFRLAARRVVSHTAPVERCLVVGSADVFDRLQVKLAGERHIELIGSIRLDEVARRLPELRRIVNEEATDRLIVAPPSAGTHEETLHLIRSARATGLAVSVMPGLLEVIGSAVEFDHVQGVTLMGVKRFGLSRSSRLLKRSFDFVGASLVMLVAAPVFVMLAVLIRLDSKGSVFYRQMRVGRDGNAFPIIKFRTMVVGAHAMREGLAHRNEAVDGLFKIADDPRITRVGRLLRKTSLDELPQLINVMRGEMSLVGPRPLVLDEDELVLGHDRRRLLLTPGMTGPWQIAGSARVPLAEMVRMDYVYVASWSLWNDILILLRTVPYVLARRGQ